MTPAPTPTRPPEGGFGNRAPGGGAGAFADAGAVGRGGASASAAPDLTGGFGGRAIGGRWEDDVPGAASSSYRKGSRSLDEAADIDLGGGTSHATREVEDAPFEADRFDKAFDTPGESTGEWPALPFDDEERPRASGTDAEPARSRRKRSGG